MVDNSVPDEADIKWDMEWIYYNRSGPPSGIREKQLMQWLEESREEETETDTPDAL